MTPRVSVIVPVRDAAGHVGRCLAALVSQTWPPEALEIIVVDDASSDETRERVRDHPVTLVVRPRSAGPYAARNAGLVRAGGEILAFTDGDCVPAKDWIAQGVAALEEQAADLAGGLVRFRFSEPPRAAELADALYNLDHERSIPERGVAKTGNLFVRRAVFDALGPFRTGRRSGGDVELTARASGAGFALVFAQGAVVEKPARRIGALLRKQLRVGRGQAALGRDAGSWRAALRGLLPARPSALREPLARRGPPGAQGRLARVWAAHWCATAAQSAGRLLARPGADGR